MASSDKNRAEYERRVNRVLDHIRAHRGEELTLEELADVASFSRFHFHRIFKSIVGENLREYIQRTRLEDAANVLVLRPQVDILEVALDSGFSSASAFARAFKERFGMSATDWRRGCNSNPGIAERKAGKAGAGENHHSAFTFGAGADAKESNMDVKIEILPAMRVAYFRQIGAYTPAAISELWHRLSHWAMPRDLWTADRLCFGVPHDNPRVTDPAKCRYDAAIAVPEGFSANGDVNLVELPGGKSAVARFVGKPWEIGPVYDRLFSEWLPQSGYQPDDRPILERYEGESYDAVTGDITCDLCAPIRPL